jgi:hypothetical protein
MRRYVLYPLHGATKLRRYRAARQIQKVWRCWNVWNNFLEKRIKAHGYARIRKLAREYRYARPAQRVLGEWFSSIPRDLTDSFTSIADNAYT